MSPCSFFHNLIWKISVSGQFSGHIQSLKCLTKIVVIIIQLLYLILIIAHDLYQAF